MKLALLFGGPSEERAISLNSARSVADHLDPAVELGAFVYINGRAEPYLVDRALLYSNTPDDFDFKLAVESRPLTRDELRAALAQCDLAFPVMHGRYGEDGQVQRLLEELGLPYVGTAAAEAEIAYHKFSSAVALGSAGLPVVPSVRVENPREATFALADVLGFAERAVLKPDAGGSSLGVHVVATPQEAYAAMGPGAYVVQPWVAATEFTIVVVEGPDGPVALVPLEVERRRAGDFEILGYREKYLATDDTAFHCPPRFPDDVVDAIRSLAERAFQVLGLRDFARIDGWLRPDGSLALSDVNVVSGMEQNSYLFVQAAQAGMSHRDALRAVVASACRRAGIDVPAPTVTEPGTRRRVGVLFGGRTAERQVSVLSGTNVWLKLLHSDRYEPLPALLLDDDTVWRLPYATCLRHSVEEIEALCREAGGVEEVRRRLAADIVARLALDPTEATLAPELPVQQTFDDFARDVDFVFIALHGGIGEDGTVQARLDGLGVPYNGSGPHAARVTMDKYVTGERIVALGLAGIGTSARVRRPVPDTLDDASVAAMWSAAEPLLVEGKVIVKPLGDGCSAGVVPLAAASELAAYLGSLAERRPTIPPGTFSLVRNDIVTLPTERVDELLFEEFVVTDRVVVVQDHLDWHSRGDDPWVEITVGVLGRRGAMRALQPSLTVAREELLTLEEKFMGGTGVNITPPPAPPLGRVEPAAVDRARRSIETVANALGIQGYARIDAFLDGITGDIVVIEANSLPGLTPATVIYHQGLAEEPPLFPRQLLERIVELGFARSPEDS